VFLGRATRVVEYHLGDRKAYRATVCFGATSTTGDPEGELTPVDAPAPTREAVEAALPALTGPISQLPPAFSAIKVAGRRAYALARAGQPVELKAREVEIDRLDLVSWDDGDPQRPVAVLDVACSAGTYIRSLARDLGAAVGSGAYLGALTRTASGPFVVGDAVALDDVRAAAGEGTERLAALLRPIDAGLEGLPAVTLPAGDLPAFARGQHIKLGAGAPQVADAPGPVRVLDASGALAGIGRIADGRLAPDKVLLDPPTAG
jgi:tRNA pseudouridine55 synthase